MFSVHIDTARTWRGGQSQALLTVQGLRARGHRTVLVAHPQGELFRRAPQGADLIGLAPRNELDLHAAWRFSRVLKRLRPDVIHAHDPHGVAMAALALTFGFSGRPPSLIASRRVDFHLKPHALSRWKYRRVECLIAVTQAIVSILEADGIPASRIELVHEGVDVDAVRAVPPASVHAEYGLPAHAPVVGNVAALVPHKGQRHLIDAAARVVAELPEVRFVIFGEGELRADLERQIRDLNVGEHVLLAGFRPDVHAFLKTFDVFVMSSVMEGLGTSLLDAMACSRPIVATRAGGIPEVVTAETGILVPPGDGAALARGIVELLRDEPRRRVMGEAGLARVNARFSVRSMVAQTLGVYERVRGINGVRLD